MEGDFMKPYADIDYFMNKFINDKSEKFDLKLLKEKLVEASQKIDEVTYNRIVGCGFDNLTNFQQEKIKEATCYQARHLLNIGEGIGDLESYSVLDINVKVKTKETEATKKGMSEMAWSTIKQTGLTNRIL